MINLPRFKIAPLRVALLLGAAAITSMPAIAGQQHFRSHDQSFVRNVSMGMGRSIIINLPRDAAEVFVGAPDVANAIVRSPRRIYIMAVKTGQTSIRAMDSSGNEIADIEVSVGQNIEALSEILRQAIPDAHIILHTVNNTIILNGEVGSPAEAQQALDIANGYLQNTTAQTSSGSGTTTTSTPGRLVNALTIKGQGQVMIKVTVAEVDRNIVKSLGLTSGNLQFGTLAHGASLALSNPFSLGAGQAAGVLGLTSGNQTATIQALERNAVGRVLAEPTLTAVSGQDAKFTAGGKLPVPSSTSCQATTGLTVIFGALNCQTTYTFQPYGVTLNFTPTVLSSGRIQLHVATNVTEIDEDHAVNTGQAGGAIPGFTVRSNETTVELPSGGSIATAGLITTQSRQAINGLPGLMNLPILGALFRSRDYLRDETELMIIVTPYLVKPVAPRALALPTDHLADATDPQSILLGKVNRIYSTAHNPSILKGYHGEVGFINE